MIAFEKEFIIRELVLGAKEGNRGNMDELVSRVQPRLKSYFLRLTGNEDLSDDLVQDTLLHMLKSIKHLQKVDSFWPWLYRIASRQWNNYLRKRPPYRIMSLEHTNESSLDAGWKSRYEQPDRHLLQCETIKYIHEAIAKLKQRPRFIVKLRSFQGFSYSQIAVRIGCSEAAARTCFFRAKLMLRQYLQSC